ncbi:alpha-1,4-N-acetylglucosaminyltransferase-like [Penaeus japonicus]|uniref:alpha-1,4-N-acetylglucosaminyltransferase-like n=1 Tax=Penaeus japonicus TaxID=27405 RepID=UPI001C715513|nr:alpha-1,4-N-acetylglucosaminyltransferase-like [Penaeus japonicus]
MTYKTFVLTRVGVSETTMAATWVTHLCPGYGLQDTSNHSSLPWKEPTQSNTIFFVQTSCSANLSPREACAVESAAHHHPTRPVLVLMTALALDSAHPLLQVVRGLDNVSFGWLDLDRVFGGPGELQEWHADRMWLLNEDRAPTAVSDAARAEVLRRFGGTYVDLDAIILRRFPDASNWLGRLDQRMITNAVLSFRKGHPLLQAAVASIPTSFIPSKCCSLGPDLFTDLLHQRCPDNITIPASAPPDAAEYCGDIVVYPWNAFYPIFYTPRELESISKNGEGLGPAFFSDERTKDAFSLHLYHSLNHRPLSLGGDSILEEAAKRSCPKVHRFLLSHQGWM